MNGQQLLRRGESKRTVKFADEEANPAASAQAATNSRKVNASKRHSILSLGGSTAKRKRRWKKFYMKLNPRYWAIVLNKALPIILPESIYRRCWDYLIMLLVVYCAIIIPYEIGFGNITYTWFQVVDWSVVGLFSIDIALNFRTAYVDHSVTLVRDGQLIAAHYFYTWFFIDLTGTLPFEAIVLAFDPTNSQSNLIYFNLLRLPRLLRLGRVLQFFNRTKGANLVRMLRLLFFMALVAHWVTCFWFMLYTLMLADNMPWTFDQIPNSDNETYYLFAYLAAVQIMLGNDIGPANDWERLYCTGVLVVGACFYAIVVGHMSLLVNNMNPTSARHKFKKDIINNTVRYLGTPKPLVRRVGQYFDYLSSHRHPGPDGMAMLASLPASMFRDITAHMYRDLVSKVPLFVKCEEAFIAQLMTKLKMSVFLPKEVIFRIGDVGYDMYFIIKGNVAVLNERGEVLSLLNKGDFFGDLALLATSRRTARCVSLSHCDLVTLSAQDLLAAMRDFPLSAKAIRTYALTRLEGMQASGTIAESSQTRVEQVMAAAREVEQLKAGAPNCEEPLGSTVTLASLGKIPEASPSSAPHDDEAAAEPTEMSAADVHQLDNLADVPASAAALIKKVQGSLGKLSGKMDTLHVRMDHIYERLKRVETGPGISMLNDKVGEEAQMASMMDMELAAFA